RTLQAYRGRNSFFHQRVERCGADGCKHAVAIVWRGTYMAAGKVVGRVEVVHPSCDWYCEASSRPSESVGLARLTRIIHVPCGSVLTTSGWFFSSSLTATTSPLIGAKSSDTAFTDSIDPNDSPAAILRPISGNSTYTTSPSCC